MTAQLYHGDCLDFMRTLDAGSVDAVVTDPPYEDSVHTPMRRTRATIEGRRAIAGIPFASMDEDTRRVFISESMRLSRGWVLTFAQVEAVGRYAGLFGAGWRRAMVWVKPDAAPQFTGDRPAQGFECICAAWAGSGKSQWNGGGSRGVFVYNSTSYHHDHETQKPVSLMVRLIELFTSPGDTVFDPFFGVGTTAVACVQTGRNFIGCEIDAGYFEIAQRRIALAQQSPMFPQLNEPAPQPEQLSLV